MADRGQTHVQSTVAVARRDRVNVPGVHPPHAILMGCRRIGWVDRNPSSRAGQYRTVSVMGAETRNLRHHVSVSPFSMVARSNETRKGDGRTKDSIENGIMRLERSLKLGGIVDHWNLQVLTLLQESLVDIL